MPEQTGKLIDTFESADSGGKSHAGADSLPANGNASGIGESEKLYGYDVEGPDTIKLAGTGDGEPRRNRDGSIDRRTLRGRRKSGTDSEAKKSNDLGLSFLNIEDLLFSIHLMGAEILSVPELELDKGEAKRLADAIHEVGKHHAMTFDPKKLAYFNLAVVMAGVYGLRLAAFRNRVATERQKKIGQQPEKTTPITQGRNQQPNTATQTA